MKEPVDFIRGKRKCTGPVFAVYGDLLEKVRRAWPSLVWSEAFAGNVTAPSHQRERSGAFIPVTINCTDDGFRGRIGTYRPFEVIGTSARDLEGVVERCQRQLSGIQRAIDKQDQEEARKGMDPFMPTTLAALHSSLVDFWPGLGWVPTDCPKEWLLGMACRSTIPVYPARGNAGAQPPGSASACTIFVGVYKRYNPQHIPVFAWHGRTDLIAYLHRQTQFPNLLLHLWRALDTPGPGGLRFDVPPLLDDILSGVEDDNG